MNVEKDPKFYQNKRQEQVRNAPYFESAMKEAKRLNWAWGWVRLLTDCFTGVSKKISEIKNNKKLSESISKICYSKINKNYTWDKKLFKYQNLL
jgi:hypothetical protein